MKKISSLFICATLLLCTLLFFSLNSCSKDEIGETTTISLSAEKIQYAPYEIVTILSSENLFAVKSFSAKINDMQVILGADENAASFVLPNLENGNYDLTFVLDQKNYIVPITVSSLSNISTADQYFNEVQTSINESITNLNSQITQLEENSTNSNEYVNLQNDVIKYTTLLNDYTTAYNNLSAIEKVEFAKTMAANKASIVEYNNLTSALYSSTVFLRTAQSIPDYEAGVEASMAAFSSSVIYTVGHIPFILAGAQLATTLNPWVSGGAILATGIITGSFLVNVSNTVACAISLTNKSIKPFEFISETSQTVYNTGVEKLSDIKAKYRSLINSDNNNESNGSTIRTIVEKFNYLKEKYNGFFNALPAIFRPSYLMTSLKNTSTNTTRTIRNLYISITNISNSNVTLQQLNQPDGSVKIKATTSATTDQTFTYNVNYINSNFTNGLTKTVNAKVTVQSCDPTEIIGTWTVEMYNTCYPNADGTPAYYDSATLILYQGGQSLWRYSDGSELPGTYYVNPSNCSFSYDNVSWCGGARAYPPSSPNYGSLHSCGCLSLKHIKQ